MKLAVDRRPELPFIFVSGKMGEEVAIEALKFGATVLAAMSGGVAPCPAALVVLLSIPWSIAVARRLFDTAESASH